MSQSPIFTEELKTNLQAFSEAEDREALVALADESPLLLTDEFAEAVQTVIDTGLRMGNYDAAEALRQRLDALKEIRAMKAYQRQDTLAQAVIAFVQAEDDEKARQTYAAYRDQLDTDAAEKMLAEDFDARDNKAHAHLRRRAAMLKQFRTA